MIIFVTISLQSYQKFVKDTKMVEQLYAQEKDDSDDVKEVVRTSA